MIRNTIGLGLDSPTRSTSAPPQDPDARPGAFIGGAARRKARRDQAPVSPPNAQAPPRSSLAPICDRVSGNLIAARNYHYQLPRLVHHHRHRAITALTRHRHSDNSRRRRDSLSAAVSRSSAAVTQRPRDRPVPSVVVAGRTYVHPSTHPSSLPPYGSQRYVRLAKSVAPPFPSAPFHSIPLPMHEPPLCDLDHAWPFHHLARRPPEPATHTHLTPARAGIGASKQAGRSRQAGMGKVKAEP